MINTGMRDVAVRDSGSWRHHVRWVFALVVVAVVGGCVTPGRSRRFTMDVPHVSASWAGGLTTVTACDRSGQTYEAAALEISAGPRMPYRPCGGFDYVACERRALLVLWGKAAVVMPPQAVGVAQKTVVRVRGTMYATTAQVPAAMSGETRGYIRYVSRGNTYRSRHELVIMMSEPPDDTNLLVEYDDRDGDAY